MLLLFFIFVPFFGAIFCLFFLRISSRFPIILTFFISCSCLLLSCLIYYKKFFVLTVGERKNLYLLEYCHKWIPEFGITFHFRLDGLSLLMIIMTSFLSCIAVLCDWRKKYKNSGLFYFLFLLILCSLLGCFISEDLFLFFFFWELSIFPVYFLILLWGDKNLDIKFLHYTLKKFLIYAHISSVLLLISILYLVQIYYEQTGLLTFDYLILNKVILSQKIEFLLMLSFFLSFIIKTPLFPFLDWYSEIQICAPTSGSINILYFLLKVSLYGFLRFNLYMLSQHRVLFSKIGIFLSIITILYSINKIFTLKNIKTIIIYLSVIHIAIIFYSLNYLNNFSLQGSVLSLCSYSLTTAALFMLLGFLKEYYQTNNFLVFKNISKVLSKFSSFFFFFIFSNIGLPGTGNFSGEILMFLGSFFFSPILTTFIIFSLLFLSGFLLYIIVQTYYGSYKIIKIFKQFTFLTYLILFFIIFLIFFIGLFPCIILDLSEYWIDCIYKKNLFFIKK
ncbi:complex I subunit 4 family protein [Buchnera aphidicola]|uniref:complex I subunit 4 family protein n=1 Tax=Buchnera aphidicola TaxID=9 RepID=UPI0031B7248E